MSQEFWFLGTNAAASEVTFPMIEDSRAITVITGDMVLAYESDETHERFVRLGTMDTPLEVEVLHAEREVDDGLVAVGSNSGAAFALHDTEVWSVTSIPVAVVTPVIEAYQGVGTDLVDIDIQSEAGIRIARSDMGLFSPTTGILYVAMNTGEEGNQMAPVWPGLCVVPAFDSYEENELPAEDSFVVNQTLNAVDGVFNVAYDGPPDLPDGVSLSNDFWENAQFFYSYPSGTGMPPGTLQTRLKLLFDGSASYAAGDGAGGPDIFPPYWSSMGEGYSADLESPYFGLFLDGYFTPTSGPGGFVDISEAVEAYITSHYTATPDAPFETIYPRGQYAFRPARDLDATPETSAFDGSLPATYQPVSAYLHSTLAGGYFSSYIAKARVVQYGYLGSRFLSEYTIAVHFQPAPSEAITGEVELVRCRFT